MVVAARPAVAAASDTAEASALLPSPPYSSPSSFCVCPAPPAPNHRENNGISQEISRGREFQAGGIKFRNRIKAPGDPPERLAGPARSQ